MAQILVRNLEEDVKRRLKKRAAQHGRSLEAEAREILRSAVRDEGPKQGAGIGTQIAALFKDVGFEEGEIQEIRGWSIKPPDFSK